MSIKRKIFKIIIIGFATMISLVSLLGYVVFGWLSESLGRQDAAHTFHHAKELLRSDLDFLAISVADWSHWDDSYDYILENNRTFESANLQELTFRNLKLSHLSITDNANRIYYQYPSGKSVFSNCLAPLRTEALRNGSASGIVEIEGKFHYAAAEAVLRTDGSGPPAGTIIMTRIIDREALGRIRTILQSEIVMELAPQENDDSRISVVRRMDGKYEVFGKIDFGARPSNVTMRLRLEKRSISLSIPFFLSTMLIALVVLLSLTGLILLTLDRTVFQRIDRMHKELKTAAASGKVSFRVTIDGDDELRLFGETLNRVFEALERSLEERDSLYQEIRHRVKNNLQVIASILSLQADEATSPETTATLQSSRRRVLSMAYIHEELYCSENLHSISLREYLERLAILIRHTLDPDESIDFTFEASELELTIARAVPFALIANEVLSNSYLHAFDEGSHCEELKKNVALTLREDAGSLYSFCIRDNGCGIKAHSAKKKNLGLTLIEALSHQIGARYSYETIPEGGTSFRMVFQKT